MQDAPPIAPEDAPADTRPLTPPLHRSPLRERITAATRAAEPALLPALPGQARLAPPPAAAAHDSGRRGALGGAGEPLIRRGVDMAMRLMGEQFVTGETIGQALANARPREAQGFRHSYDMLGEAATTAHDAARYLASYEAAIDAIG